MLDVGFEQEVDEIVRLCPSGRQTMLFSATISSSVAKLAKLSLDKPIQVKVDPIFNVADNLQQEFVRLRPAREFEREAVLLSLVTRTFTSRTIVFLASKKHAHRMHILFGLFGLRAAELHGNLTQQQRLQSLDEFREGKVDFLLATDLAGRGLDIRGVSTVINYDLPTELKTYIHRVGRTARAGSEGRAVSIVAERDRAFLKQVLKHASDVVKTRTVPPESISHWVDKLSKAEEEVGAVMQDEAEEKAIRVAEMEVNKATNIMQHREEIMSRPARSWFQTEQEKQALKEESKRKRPVAAMADDGDDGDAGADADAEADGGKGGARKKSRNGQGGVTEAAEAAPAKTKAKRDPNAGLSRIQRRRKEREKEFSKHCEESGIKQYSAQDQKAAARGAKAKERKGLKSGMTAGLLKKMEQQREKSAEKRAAA